MAEARAARVARVADGEQVAGRPRTANTAANVKKVLAYREKGHSMCDIARLTGSSSGSVHRILSANLMIGVAPYDPAYLGEEPERA